MTTDDKLKICEKLLAYKQSRGLSNRQLATEIGNGLSLASVSNIANKKVQLISDELFRRIGAFLHVDNWRLLETDNYAIIQESCCDAQEFGRFFAIAAKTGLGKTEAFKSYTGKGANCFYMLSNVLMSRQRFLQQIQRCMGIDTGISNAELMDGICNKLLSAASPLLIIDDAGKLSDGCLRLIQLIYDRTEHRAGIILAGTPYLRATLERGKKSNKQGFEEIFRRIECWVPLFEPTMHEKLAICEENGLDKGNAISKFIANSSSDFGALRNKITLALRLKNKGQLSITALQNSISRKPLNETSGHQKEAA